jgi:hypothetical protein
MPETPDDHPTIETLESYAEKQTRYYNETKDDEALSLFAHVMGCEKCHAYVQGYLRGQRNTLAQIVHNPKLPPLTDIEIRRLRPFLDITPHQKPKNLNRRKPVTLPDGRKARWTYDYQRFGLVLEAIATSAQSKKGAFTPTKRWTLLETKPPTLND